MSDDTLERLRMCVAEAGYDPAQVQEVAEFEGHLMIAFGTLPHAVTWRAREIMRTAPPACEACTVPIALLPYAVKLERLAACRADRYLTLDCGVSRG